MSIGAEGGPVRILYVLPYVPSPIRVRPYQLIRHLAAQGHVITVAALEDARRPNAEARAELRRVCREVHVVPLPLAGSAARALASVPTRTPLWAAWCKSPRMEHLLRGLAQSGQFDVAHVEHLRAAHFDRALDPLPRLLDAVDCITELRRQMMVRRDGAKAVGRLLSRFEWRKLLRYEPRAYKPYRAIAVTSEHDARSLASLDPLLPPIEVVPNGVDLTYFMPGEEAPRPDSIVFSGKMSYSANDDAARYLISAVLPRIRARRPGAHLTIVGSGPTPALLREAAQAGGVEVTGYVDDIRPYLRRSVAALCPMRIGVGIQNKALEAMATGRPVVCSTIAARSLGAARPPAVRVADDPEAFAEATLTLLSQPEEAARGGREARLYVERFHDWKTAAESFAKLYRVVQSDWMP